jgi:hypothetical protein
MVDLYPYAPGTMGLTVATLATSTDAAKAIAPSRKRLVLIAMHTLHTLGAATRFEAIAASGAKASALQPRFSELIALGLVEPTGARRRNPDTGKGGAELRLTEKGRARLEGGAA